MWIINNSLDVIHTLEDKQLAINKLSTKYLGLFYSIYKPTARQAFKRLNCIIYWKGSLTPEERASLLPITYALSGRMIGSLLSTLTSLVGSFVPVLTFLSTISTSVSETRFFDKLLVYRWATSAPLLADLFLHTFGYDFMLTTMKQDMTKAVSFGYTFRYIDDLFSVNSDSFEEYISSFYPSELELKDTTMASNEVCYLYTRIKNKEMTAHLTISARTTREMTSTFGSSIFPIWIVTSRPILPTVFIYLNW